MEKYENQVVQQGGSEKRKLFAFASKFYNDPAVQTLMDKKRMQNFDNVRPQYERLIMDDSTPTIGYDDGRGSNKGSQGGGMMSHLAHMLRMRSGQVEDTTDETRIENYVKRNEGQPNRVYPVYHLDPMFKAPKHFAYIMDFNEVKRQVVGRSSTCEVHLKQDILSASDMKLISRQHAAFISNRDEGMRIQDVSVNGTMVNGELLHKDNRKCYPGDVITFGGPNSGAQYLLSLLEMGSSGHEVEDETGKWVTKSAEELLEEAEDEIARMPYKGLQFNDIPRIQEAIINDDVVEAMMQCQNVVRLWRDMVDCDTIMACKVFRVYSFSSNQHQALHAAGGFSAIAKDLVGVNHIISTGGISALLHTLEVGLATARELALLALMRMMDASADARARLQRDGGLQVLARIQRSKLKKGVKPSFMEVAKEVLDKARQLDMHVRPRTAVIPGRPYRCPKGRPYTPFGSMPMFLCMHPGRKMRGDDAVNTLSVQRQQRPSTAGAASVMDSTMDYSFAFNPGRRYTHNDTSYSDTEVGDSLNDTIGNNSFSLGSESTTRPGTAEGDYGAGRDSKLQSFTRPATSGGMPRGKEILLGRPHSALQLKASLSIDGHLFEPKRSGSSNSHAVLEGRPPPPPEGEISRRMRQEDVYEDINDGGDAEEQDQFEEIYDAWGVGDEEEISEVLTEYVTRDERARPMTAHASTGWQGRPKSAVARPSSAVVALTSHADLLAVLRPTTPSGLAPISEAQSPPEARSPLVLEGVDGGSPQLSPVSPPIDGVMGDIPVFREERGSTRSVPLVSTISESISSRDASPFAMAARPRSGAYIPRPVSALPSPVHFRLSSSATGFIDEPPIFSRPMSAAVSFGDSDASTRTTRVGTPSGLDIAHSRGGSRPISAAIWKSEGSAGLAETAGDGEDLVRFRELPRPRKDPNASDLVEIEAQSMSGFGASFSESSQVVREIFERKGRLRKIEEQHRKEASSLHSEIILLQERLKELKGSSWGGSDVPEQVLGRVGNARVKEAITASRKEMDQIQMPDAPPPLPHMDRNGGPVRPHMTIQQSVGDHEEEGVSLKHGAAGDLHGDDVWALENKDREELGPQLEIIERFEALTPHEQKSMLRIFADRFRHEFMK